MNKKIKFGIGGGNEGFTLIEILIVVAIIAILASVVIIGLGPTQRAGRDARRAADLRQVQNGLELYFNKCGYYPGGVQATTPCGAFGAISTWTQLRDSLTQSSIGILNIPTTDPSGRSYGYITNTVGTPGTQYIMRAQLDDVNSSLLQNDLDGNPGGLDCNDATGGYCIGL